MKKTARVMTCALSIFVIVACRQVVGIDDAPPPRESTMACGIPTANGSCAECVATSCCDDANRCAASSVTCADLARCLSTCGDRNCEVACRTQFPAAAQSEEAALLNACENASCAEACNRSPQRKCGGYLYPDVACGDCASASCCEQERACMKDRECSALAACERSCAPANVLECAALCELKHPAGVPLERAFGNCLSSTCSKVCVPPRWACAKTPKPAPSGTTSVAAVTYSFSDYETFMPIKDLELKACGATDAMCTSPIVTTVTDPRGVATLLIPASPPFVGYVQTKHLDYPTMLLYRPPITKDLVTPPNLVPKKFSFVILSDAMAKRHDESRGVIFGVGFDCQGLRGNGVKFEIDPAAAEGSTPFYFAGRIPSKSATETDNDGFGSGGFVNVHTNTTPVTITATVAESGLKLSSKVAWVRNDPLTLTIVSLHAGE